MRSHPTQAARVLESLPAAEAAGVFVDAPARVAAGVLMAMHTKSAAQCIAALPDPRALELLVAMNTPTTVGTLRHLPEPRRRALIAGLPTTAALAASMLLNYADDSLGAWCDPDVLVLAPDALPGSALERVRKLETEPTEVFIADAQHKLIGVVSLAALLKAPQAVTLVNLMTPPVGVLAANASLASAASHPAWRLGSRLPVVDPANRLVGALGHDALTRALERQSHRPSQTNLDTSATGWLVRGYWDALSGLLDVGMTLLPKVPPVMPPTQRHEH